MNILAIDYRGYGESEGHPTETGLDLDSMAAYRYLSEVLRVSQERILIFGHSLGAAVAVNLAVHVRAAALIVEGAFASLPDLAQELYPFLPVKLIARNHFDSVSRIANVHGPKLFIRARGDRLVSEANFNRLYQAAPEPKRLLEVRGGHAYADGRDDQEFLRGLHQFLSTTRSLASTMSACDVATGGSGLESGTESAKQ